MTTQVYLTREAQEKRSGGYATQKRKLWCNREAPKNTERL